MTKSVFISALAMIMLFFTINNSNAQSTKKQTKKTITSTIQVIQFHSENRCMTCNLIEKLTRELLQKYPSIPFTMINVDNKKNEKMAEKFEASGTALFLYNPITGAKKDMTNFAFMNASSKPDEFKKGIEKEIKAFK